MDEASGVSDLDLGVLEANSTTSECNIEQLSSIAQHEVVNRPDWSGDEERSNSLPLSDDI
jgi:hypothetical protein